MLQCSITSETRNIAAASLAGILFSLAWWLLIDANIFSNVEANNIPDDQKVVFYFYLPGIASTLALVVLNALPPDALSGDGGISLGESSSRKYKLALLVTFVLAFCGLIASGWIFFAVYVAPATGIVSPWPGAALFTQNILIFFSMLIMRFGRKYDYW